MKALVKELFRRLPPGFSELAQQAAWKARSGALVMATPLIRFLAPVLGARFPLCGMPKGVVPVGAVCSRIDEIPVSGGPPIASAMTLGSLKLEEFADLPVCPSSILLAEIRDAWVDGATGAVMDESRRLIIELSPYAKRSPAKRPWDHPVFFKIGKPGFRKIPGTAVLLANPNGAVYFHWLLELLPRLGLFASRGMLPDDYVCLVPKAAGFVADSLGAAGIADHRLVVLEPGAQYRVERLLTTSDLFPQGMAGLLAPWLRGVFLKSAAGAEKPSASLIYITRRDSGLRTVVDERKLTDIVEDLGGKVVSLEGMDVSAQAQLFDSASCIVAPHGSSLANLVFCRPQTRILELYSPAYVRLLYPRIGNSLGLDYWYLIGKGKRERPGCPSLYASIHVDVSLFRDTLLHMMRF